MRGDKSDTYEDAFNLFLGDKISHGMSRQVFVFKYDPDIVVKVEQDAFRHQNIMEYEVWNEVRDTEFAKWFAPVVDISPNGQILMMRRTQPARLKEYPDKIPAFFTDMKKQNFGMIGGKLVCHDYGVHLLMTQGLTNKLRRAEWYDE